MIYNSYVLFDKVRETYELPMFAKNDGEMARILAREFGKYPAYVQDDYLIMFNGKFDADKGNYLECSTADGVRQFKDFGDRCLRTFIERSYHQLTSEVSDPVVVEKENN